MTVATLIQFGGLVATSVLVAFGSLWVLAGMDRRHRQTNVLFGDEDANAVAFLFDDETLIDATPMARSYLATAVDGSSDWDRLISVLQPVFEDIVEQVGQLADQGEFLLKSKRSKSSLTGTWKNGLARLSLSETEDVFANIDIDRPGFDAMIKELGSLRTLAEFAPFLVWRQRPSGEITWANDSFLSLSHRLADVDNLPVWPPVPLFDLPEPSQKLEPTRSMRVSVTLPHESDPRWFECFETSVGVDRLFTAVSADKTVKAERTLRDFVQTLTNTFAHLTIGLAIFDKQRCLTLFNPALTDLTSLPTGFLSSRPTLPAVLDRLREKKMIPEPKDYKSWRRQLDELEVAATNGTYEETWSLANGQTFRVTGRPHLDGAVAFIFEDISAEIKLTRRFRAQLEIGQAVVDSFEEAIAVFGGNGKLSFSNDAYAKLWGGPKPGEAVSTIVGATGQWSESCSPTPVWGDAREFVRTFGERAEWFAEVRLSDGRFLDCRFKPIASGATLVGFKPQAFASPRQDATTLAPPISEISPATA